MPDGNYYLEQVKLLMDILPLVARQDVFALKGGTAINFFIRDLPRLSVDIDLTYLPIAERAESLSGIAAALKELSRDIKALMPAAKINSKLFSGKASALFVAAGGVQAKIEPNTVLRGSVYPPEKRELCSAAQELFQRTVVANVLSVADLYGGKICAALDRQHPRDLFDVKLLLENEGLTDAIRKAFVVYLASHNRPMHELLDPSFLDIKQAFEGEFSGMSRIAVEYADLVAAREQLIGAIKKGLTDDEKAFLVSIKEGTPVWSRLDIPGIEKLPGIQWKLANISRMDKKKQADMLSKLKQVLAR